MVPRILREHKYSILSLVATNLLPLAGVFILGWDARSLLLLYWTENLVIGFYNILKMFRARGKPGRHGVRYLINGQPAEKAGRGGLIVFFLFHYGLFTLVHGVMVISLFGLQEDQLAWVAISFLFLLISHGVSFVTNFLGDGEYRQVSYQALFLRPYPRVVAMHLAILFGGFAAMQMDYPPAALVVLVLVKILIDLILHLLERRKFKKIN